MNVKLIDEYKNKKQIIKRIYENNNKIEIPIKSSKFFNKIIKKNLIKRLYKNDIRCVILSNELKNRKDLIIELNENNITIMDGRILFKYLILDTIKYIVKNKQKQIEESVISVMVNNTDNLINNTIIEIAKKVKRLNIITDHIEKFKRIEDYLYNELGIMVVCTNNRKSSLTKSDIIINIDFIEERFNEFKIQTNPVVICITEKINIKIKKFTGVNINYFNIDIPEKYKADGFCNEELYEKEIYSIKNYQEARKVISNDNVRIIGLIGNNGKIEESEFKQNINVNY